MSEKYLLGKWSGGSFAEGAEEIFVGKVARLEDEEAGVEVEGRRRPHLGRPGHLVGALLAVADGILLGVTPCLLTKTVHHSIEGAVGSIKQVVYVVIHLNVRIQIHHLAILFKLHHNHFLNI